MDLLDRLRLEHPIVQAGLGGGIARAELAGAVSDAGGLGTLGIMPPDQLDAEITEARERAPGRPVAVNLLLPFTKPGHVRACVRHRVDAVVLFYGFAPEIVTTLREAGIVVVQQVGTADEARRAFAQGIEAVIAQGLEAGGHLLAAHPLDEALAAILEVADGKPVLAAGGVADRERVRALLGAGASAVVAGTRFLLTGESHAHPEYKRRVLGARRTLETELFGFGWPARHRVTPNAATERWCADQEAGPTGIRAVNNRSGRLAGLVPLGMLQTVTRLQHPKLPLLSPGPVLRGMPAQLVESTALYAGVVARDIHQLVPAANVVDELTPH